MKNNKKGVGFKNFRRFEDFPVLEFGDITYMVGRNNSGKSTMVKALLLIIDYLQNQLSDTFSFDNKVLEDANIVTFGRAKCNLIDDPEIVFNLKLNNYNITIHISGDDGRTKANVTELHINDEVNGYELTVNYTTGKTSVKKSVTSVNEAIDTKEEISKMNSELHKLKSERNSFAHKFSKESLGVNDQINKLNSKIEKIQTTFEEKDEESIAYSLEYPLKFQVEVDEDLLTETGHFMGAAELEAELNAEVGPFLDSTDIADIKVSTDNSLSSDELETIKDEQLLEYGVPYKSEVFTNNIRKEDNELKEIISIFLSHNTNAHKQVIDKRYKDLNIDNSEEDNSSDIIELDNTREELKRWINQLVFSIDQQSFFYLGANPSKQSALFPLRDKGNALAQAIHEFHQLGIQEGDAEYRFVQYWMEEFEVGENFKIEFYAGEAYEFHVFDENENVNHLSDKGMGSLQAMLLILRVASLIRINKKNKIIITLLVEEPELSLHPELQSRLTDFFHDVNAQYKFNFIIETHSEYMIRQSQFIGLDKEYFAENELNENPFKVFYFHKEEGPYEMIYKEDSKFERSFGKGFFNEADNIAMRTYKLNLKRKK